MYQEDLTVLLEQLLETFTVLDTRGVVCSQSPWFERILGYRQGELTGKSVFSYIHPDDRPLVAEAFAKVSRTPGTTTAVEFRFQHRDGSWHVLQVAGKSLVDSAEEIRVVVSARNVTERKRAEEALHESEEKYRDLVENINDAIYAHDEKGVLTYVSPIIETFSGYRPEELIGRSFAEFIHPEDLPALLASFYRTLAGSLEPSEFRAIAKSGEIRWVRSSSRPIRKGDHVVGLRGVLTDISERKRAEQQTAILLEVAKDISGTLNLQDLLHLVERRTAEALACRTVATFFWDAKLNLFRMTSHYGFSEADLPSPEERCFPASDAFRRILDGQTVIVRTTLSSFADLPAWLVKGDRAEALVAPLLGRGKPRGLLLACSTTQGNGFDQARVDLCDGIARQLAVGIEAAELYQAQQEESATASSLVRVGQELIASLETPAILQRLCRLTVELLECQCSYAMLWRRTEEESFQTVISYTGTQEEMALMRSLKIPCSFVAELSKRFGDEEMIELTLAEFSHFQCEEAPPPHDISLVWCVALRQGKELIGVQAMGYRQRPGFAGGKQRVAHGIAQIASLALANARLLEELERANRLKQDFVGTMSHELRTPLNVILGYNELMREGAFGELSLEQVNILERMNRSATQLLELINSTLDLSRMQSQNVPMSLTTMGVPELFTELETEFHSLHKNSSVTLEWHIEPELLPLRTDPVKLKMVLKNLIGNALKFTNEGVVSVSASTHGNGVEFLVRDTGIGIPSEAQTFIFEPFRQVDGSMTRRYGGVGLGLYIVRQLLELLGGAVSLESDVGKGSLFRVWVPNGEPERRQVAPS
jgi:PAS domain S-box-containing protein